MKKTLIVLAVLLSGMTHADAAKKVTITSNGNIYHWVGGTEGSYGTWWVSGATADPETAANWKKITTAGQQEPIVDDWAPKTDTAFIGYTYSAENGTSIYTMTDTAIVVNDGYNHVKNLYLGDNVIFNATSGDHFDDSTIHLGTHSQYNASFTSLAYFKTVTFDYGALEVGEGAAMINIHAGDNVVFKYGGTTTSFTGTYTLSGDVLTRTLLSSTGTIGNYNLSTWTAESFNLYGSDNKELTYKGVVSGLDALSAGESGLVVTSTAITLVAKNHAVPEPATATLALLGLAGVAARRRRR